MPEVPSEDLDSGCPPGLKSLKKCIFCKNDLTEEAAQITGAKLTVCFHSVCQQCVEGWNDKDSKCCPECGVAIPKDLVDHKFLQELTEKPLTDATQKGLCGNGIHSPRPATQWCDDCDCLVCEDCIKAHMMLQNTTRHKIVDASTFLSKSLVEFNCKLHPTKQLEIFCGRCEVMTCRDCQLEHHKQHNDYEFIDVLCKEYKKELMETQYRLCQTRKSIEGSQKAAQKLQNDLQFKKRMLHKEINELKEKIVKYLNEKFNSLLHHVDSVIDEDLEKLASKISVTNEKVAPLSHSIEILDLMLEHSSDNTVFYVKKHMQKCLKLFKNYVDLANRDVTKNLVFKPVDTKALLDEIGKVTDCKNISAELKNDEGKFETYRPIFKKVKPPAGYSDAPKADKTPARIQCRQDLQSPESHKSMERISSDSRASNSPDTGSMPHWHIPQEPPSLTSPARQQTAQNVANNISLRGILAAGTSRPQPPPVSQAAPIYTPSVQSNLQQRALPEEPARTAAVQYVLNEASQQQMQSLGLQMVQPPSYYAAHQPVTSRAYTIQTAPASRRQNAPVRTASSVYQDLMRNNDVSLTPTFQIQQTTQTQQQAAQHQTVQLQTIQQPLQMQKTVQQQPTQVQSLQMHTMHRQSGQVQSMQLQNVQQQVQVQSMQLQGAHLQSIQHMELQIPGYIPGSTHNPYPQL